MANEPFRLTQTGEQVQQDLNDMEALAPVTEESAGLMSVEDKQKLDGLPSGTELENSLGGKVDKVPGKGLSTNDYTDADKAKVDGAYVKPPTGIPGTDLAVLTIVGIPESGVYADADFESTVCSYSDFHKAKQGEYAFIKVGTGNSAKYYPILANLSFFFDGIGIVTETGIYTITVSNIFDEQDNVFRSVTTTYLAFPTAQEKDAWSAKYTKPSGGIPSTDMTEAVQTSLGKADTALQSQKQADWNEADPNDPAYIKNKPNIPSGVVVDQTYDATSENAQSGVAMAGALAGKQDTISDLSDIRTGAGLGATAVQPEAGKGLFSGNYNDLSNKPDLSGFITKSVDDLVNYYLKSETYTKTEVQNLIAAINQFHYEIYASTSAVTSPASNVLYLIGPTGTGADKYEEYVYDSTKQDPWVKIGDTSIDLSGYVTTTALNTALADYTTTANLTTLLAGKQDKIDSTHKLDYSLIDNTPTIPDAVEANPTVPSGTTPSDLTGLKVGNGYYAIPTPTVDNTPTANSDNLVKSGGVYSEVHPGIVTTQPVGGFAPGIVYDLGTLTGTVTFALASPSDATVPNAYHWTFDTGSTEPTVNWPSGIVWPDNVTPTIEAGKHYEVLVRKGYASIIVYTLPTE